MSQPGGWVKWVVCGVLAASALMIGGCSRSENTSGQNTEQQSGAPEHAGATHVEVVHPQKARMERTTVQPGSVQSFEWVNLYAEVTGYLKTQTVDIGSRVKKGQTLATLDVPELDKEVERNAAAVDQARARVTQMKARVVSARADLEAAEAGVTQAEANAKSKAAELRFREQQLKRMQDLFASRSIDERLVDEKTEQRDAALEAKNAAIAAIATSKAQAAASQAKVESAEADVTEAQSEVKVAQAVLEKSQVLVKFATITAPFDGVISRRNYFPGDYIRAAEGSTRTPLLTVERTDLLRVVVQVPDRDVPFTTGGDPATVEIDALPGEKFQGKVARMSQSEDPETRLMHVEIDLPNTTGKITNGMYGRVIIDLRETDMLTVPPSSLVGKGQGGKGSVFVVRDGHARQTPVIIGADNGVQVGIVQGLKPEDEVVVQPSGLDDGTPVTTTTGGS